MDKSLKISQDRLEEQLEDERIAEAVKCIEGEKLTKAIHRLNEKKDREALSRSSGGRTVTTQGSDGDLEHTFSSKEHQVLELRKIKKSYEQAAQTASGEQDPNLFNPIGEIDSLGQTAGNTAVGDYQDKPSFKLNLTKHRDEAPAAQKQDDSLNAFDAIESPEKRQPMSARVSITNPLQLRKKKKFVKRIVKKENNPKREAALKKKQAESAQISKAFTEIQNGVMDVLNNRFFF